MASSAPQPLTGDALHRALDRITAWRLNPQAAVTCPSCEAVGLSIVDRSSRPYVEWYALTCATCGLEQTIQIPMGPPVMSGLD